MTVEEEEMVQVCLGGQASKFRAFQTAACTREITPSFFELQLMLLIEKNHTGASTSTHTDNMMLYMEADWSHSCGGRGGLARNGGTRHEQD